MKEEIKTIIEYINWNFSEIRGDWSDPRWNCREGWEAVSWLKSVLGEPPEKPYFHGDERTLQDFLRAAKDNMESKEN